MNENSVSISALAKKITILAKKHTTFIVGIDGKEGSGKSTVAESLRRLLPLAIIIPLDDFYSSELGEVDRKRVIVQVIRSLKHNETAKYQRFDWNKDGLMEWRNVQNGGILLVEGATALHDDFRGCYDLTIWVECPVEAGILRGVTREGSDDKIRFREKILAAWLAKEKDYLSKQNPKQRADYTFDNSRPLPASF